MNKKPVNKTKMIISGVVIAVLLVVIFFWSSSLYKSESQKTIALILDNKSDVQDYLKVDVQITGVDPVKGDVNARIDFYPYGALTDDDMTINKDINLYINSAAGKQEYNFAKGKVINPIDVTLSIFDGLASDYPFDKHKAELMLYFTTPEYEKRGDSVVFNEWGHVETEVNFSAVVHGYIIKASKDAEATKNDYTLINIEVSRTNSVIVFSVFIMIIMWVLAIFVIAILLSVTVGGRKVELGMFGYAAAMLFAMPAMRNMQPLVPPIGCYSDYVSFFWAEMIFSICLAVFIITWLVRKEEHKL